jgi:3-deoxy-D-manno-octulosonic-acid transferase
MLLIYRAATTVLGPFASAWLGARARAGKEDAGRLGERFGRYTTPRPAGPLMWLHAASVGESGVALALIDALAARDPNLRFLLSTGTRTSADLAAKRADKRTTHVYAPLDRSDAVRRFLEHWRPDAGVFVESEIWPNLILEAERRGVPLALVNARMSVKTLRRWARWAAAGRRLLRAFAFVSAADARTAHLLSDLRLAPIPEPGNLKLAAPAPSIEAGARAAFAASIGSRPVWLAASTHAGEDEIMLAAHQRIRATSPQALLVIAPRHPERGEAVAALAGGAPRRSRGEPIGHSAVYVADTLGELGMLYSAASVALVAGSMSPALKGHNPIEPAKLGAAILVGPHVESFQDVYDALFAANGAQRVDDPESIANAVLALWCDEAARARQLEAARGVVDQGADAFAKTVAALAALLPADARKSEAHASA